MTLLVGNIMKKTLFVLFSIYIILSVGCRQKENIPPSAYISAAIVNSDLKEVKKLIRKNPDLLNIRMRIGELEFTPLSSCIATNKTEIALYLIKSGADINYRNLNGTSIAQLTVNAGNYEVFSALVNNDVNLETIDSNGSNIYHYAIFKPDFRILDTLYQRIPYLLDRPDSEGATPFLLAITHFEMYNVAMWFLQKGASLDNALSEYPLLVEMMMEKHTNELNIYLNENDETFRNYLGENTNYTLSHFAIGYRNKEFLEYLLKSGYYSNQKDIDGFTPRDLAVNFYLTDYIELIDNYSENHS